MIYIAKGKEVGGEFIIYHTDLVELTLTK